MNNGDVKKQLNYKSIKNLSFSISLLFHLLLLLLFLVLKFSIDYPEQDYVELSFGVSGELGSSGAIGSQITDVEELSKPEEKNETIEKAEEVKEVELPKAKTTEDENIIEPADEEKEVSIASKTESKEEAVDEATSEGQGNISEQEGSFGFEFESGGLGKRRLLTVVEPTYPDGVQKEINIRLKFSILPDGTVGSIIPLTKADVRLENAAINALRQCRFEALSPNQKQVEQTAVVVAKFRLQ